MTAYFSQSILFALFINQPSGGDIMPDLPFPICVPDEMRKTAKLYEASMRGDKRNELVERRQFSIKMFLYSLLAEIVCIPAVVLLWNWGNQYNPQGWFFLLVASALIIFSVMPIFGFFGLLASATWYFGTYLTCKNPYALTRLPEEDDVVSNKMDRMAYRVVRGVDAVNSCIAELDLHRRMEKLGLGKLDEERILQILMPVHERVCLERERYETLRELRERRESRALDLSGASDLLDQASVDALAELQAELEVDPETVLSTLHDVLAMDSLDAELGDVKALERERDARKKRVSAQRAMAKTI